MANGLDYTTAWIDTTIHDFLAEIEEPPPSMAYALVTCLDSSLDVPAVLAQGHGLSFLQGKYTIVGQGALLTTRRLLDAEHRTRLFFGFDEVWFFSDAGRVRPKPREFVITGPYRITADLLARGSAWLEMTGCSLGLGDGAGMNCCARLRGVAKCLFRALGESDAAVPSEGEVRA